MKRRLLPLLLALLLLGLTACGGASLREEANEEKNSLPGTWKGEVSASELWEGGADTPAEVLLILHEDKTATVRIREADLTGERTLSKEDSWALSDRYGQVLEGYRTYHEISYTLEDGRLTLRESQGTFHGTVEKDRISFPSQSGEPRQFTKCNNDGTLPEGILPRIAEDRLTAERLSGTWIWELDLADFSDALPVSVPVSARIIFDGNVYFVKISQKDLEKAGKKALKEALKDEEFFKEVTGLSRSQVDGLLGKLGTSLDTFLEPFLPPIMEEIMKRAEEVFGKPDNAGDYNLFSGTCSLLGYEITVSTPEGDATEQYRYDPETQTARLPLMGTDASLKKEP